MYTRFLLISGINISHAHEIGDELLQNQGVGWGSQMAAPALDVRMGRRLEGSNFAVNPDNRQSLKCQWQKHKRCDVSSARAPDDRLGNHTIIVTIVPGQR